MIMLNIIMNTRIVFVMFINIDINKFPTTIGDGCECIKREQWFIMDHQFPLYECHGAKDLSCNV